MDCRVALSCIIFARTALLFLAHRYCITSSIRINCKLDSKINQNNIMHCGIVVIGILIFKYFKSTFLAVKVGKFGALKVPNFVSIISAGSLQILN